MSAHPIRGFRVSSLFTALIVLSAPAPPLAAGGEELRPDNSLESRALELLSQRKGQISGARLVESTPASVTVRVAFTGLPDKDLRLTARALDRRRRPIREIREAESRLQSDTGEATIQLIREAGLDEPLEQRFVRIQIGPERGRDACVKTFVLERDWGPGGGGGGGGTGRTGMDDPGAARLSVTAVPVGRSQNLPVQKPFTAFRAFDEIKPVAATTTFRAGPTVRDHRTGGGSRPYMPLTGTVNPGIRPLPKPPGAIIPCIVVGIPPEVAQAQGKGPGASGFSLYDIASDVNVAPEEISSLHPIIFEDENPQSGFFYYLPRSFHLDWDPQNGYAFKVLYGASIGQNPNTVYISARLTAGLNAADLGAAEKLAQRYFRGRFPNGKFNGLKPFPISGIKPEINGEAYNIPKEKLTVTPAADLGGAITLSFTTDPVTTENLKTVLTQGLGLSGTVGLLSASGAGEGKLEANVPLSIRFADRASFGAAAFVRDTPFRNAAPYPIRLKYLHALLEENPPRVYSYNLGDRTLASGGVAQLDTSQVRPWLESSAIKFWVEYGVQGTEAGHKKAMEAATGGVSSVTASEITFRTLTPLADTGAALIQVTVSSRYLDPKGQLEKTATLELNKDNEAFKLRPIYLLNRQPDEERPGDPLFKYRLTVVKPDGTVKEGKEWIPSNKMTLFIGSVLIKPILEAS